MVEAMFLFHYLYRRKRKPVVDSEERACTKVAEKKRSKKGSHWKALYSDRVEDAIPYVDRDNIVVGNDRVVTDANTFTTALSASSAGVVDACSSHNEQINPTINEELVPVDVPSSNEDITGSLFGWLSSLFSNS